MSKPDGIAQDAWDATDKIRNEPFHWKGPEECAFLVAKAIMAAKAEEREACALEAFDRNKAYGWSGTRQELLAYIEGRSDAEAAIRSRT